MDPLDKICDACEQMQSNCECYRCPTCLEKEHECGCESGVICETKTSNLDENNTL